MVRAMRAAARRVAALAFLSLPIATPPAEAAVGDWVQGDHARMRLIAVRTVDGNLDAAVEVILDPGWKTYWRTPGSAGLPPALDFSASTNVSTPAVAFPVPARHDDGYGISNVYKDRVLLSVSARAVDAAKPAELRLAADIGVCEEVCVPVHFDVALTVPPAGADQPGSDMLASARGALPGTPEPGRLAAEGVKREGGTDRRPVFDVSLRVPDPGTATVFVEGPVDWYSGVPELLAAGDGQATYRVAFDRLRAKTPIAGATLIVTIVTPEKAVEDKLTLD